MAGKQVNLNQSVDFVNKYLSDLGINKTVTSKDVMSIFNSLEKNEDGTIDTTDFALAVANKYGDNEYTELEDEYLEAWEEFANADGNKDSVSMNDILAGGEAGEAEAAEGSGAGYPEGAGSLTTSGDLKSTIQPANITGNESSSELEASRSEALSKLSELQSQKDNNEAVKSAQEAVDKAKEAYDTAMEDFKENEAELFKQIEELNKNKEEKDKAISDKKSVIDGIKTEVSAKESEISTAKGELSSLVEPNQADFAQEAEDGSVTYPGYEEALAAYEEQKQALEEKIAALEDELTDLQTKLASEEEALATLEEEALNIDSEIFTAMQSEEMQNNEYARAVNDALQAYYDAKDNVIAVKNNETAQIDADIAQLRKNITAYDTAIDAAKEKESQEEKAEEVTKEAAKETSQEGAKAQSEEIQDEEEVKAEETDPEKEKECEVDPIGVNGEDGVTYDFIKDDGDFDTVSDLLGSSDLGIQELTNLNTDGDNVITGEELAAGNIKVVRTDAEGNQTLVSIDDLETELGGNISIDISSINNESEENQDFSVNVVDDKGDVTATFGGYSTFETSASLAARYGVANDLQNAEETFSSLSNFYESLQAQGNGGYSKSEWEKLMGKSYGDSYALRGLIDVVGSIYGEDSEIYQLLNELPNKMSVDLKKCEKYIAVNDKENETKPGVGDIVFTDEANGSNPHSGIIVEIKIDESGNTTYVVAEANSAVSNGGQGVALREYNLGGNGKAIRGFIPVDQEPAPETDSKLPEGWSEENGVIKDDENNTLLAVDYEEIENNGWTVDENGIIKDSEGNEIGKTAIVKQDTDNDGAEDDVTSYYMHIQAVNEEDIANNGYTIENGVIKDSDGNEIGKAITTSKDVDNDGIEDDVTSYYVYGKAQEEEASKTPEEEQSTEHAVSSSELKENYPGYIISDDKILDADGNEIGRIEETIQDITGDGFTDKITQYYLYDAVTAQEPVSSSQTPEEEALSEKIAALASEDEDIANAAWEALNITEETPVDDLLELSAAYDDVHGEGAFLERAKDVFGSTYYDSIMERINKGYSDDVANADYNTRLSDGTEVGDVIANLKDNEGAWTEEFFESLSDKDVAILAKVYGIEPFKAAIELYLGNKTDFSIINEKLNALPILTQGNGSGDPAETGKVGDPADAGKVEDPTEFSERFKDITNPNALGYINQISEIEANIAELKEQGMDSYIYEEQKNISGILDEALKDDTVSVEDRMKIMVGISEKYNDIVIDYLHELKYSECDSVIDMVEQCETVEEITAMSDAFAQIYGEGSSANSLSGYLSCNLSNNSEGAQRYVDKILQLCENSTIEDIIKLNTELGTVDTILSLLTGDLEKNAAQNYVNTIIKLYENATPEDISKLNKELDTAGTIQKLLSGDAETNALINLMDKIAANLPDDASNYTNLEDYQLEAYKDTYTTVNGILSAVTNNKIDKGTGLYLLKELTDGDMTSLISKFRGSKKGEQEEYLPVLLDMFTSNFDVKEKTADAQNEPMPGINGETAIEYASQINEAMERMKWYEENEIYPNDHMEQKRQLTELLTDTLKDETVSVQDKIAILDNISDKNSDMVREYLSVYSYPDNAYDFIINMTAQCESIEDINSLSELFGKIYDEGSSANSLNGYILCNLSKNGNSESAQNYVNAIIKLYENATPEEIAGLNTELDTAATIQYLLSGDVETTALVNLMNKIAVNLPDNASAYTDLREKTLKYYQEQYSSIESVLKAVNSGNIDSRLGLYLIKEKYNGDMEALVSDFRSMWRVLGDPQKEYLPVLLSLFEIDLMGTES